MTFLVSSPEGIQVSMLCVGFAVALCPPFRWSMYLGRNLEDAFLAATQWPLTNKPPRQFSLTYLRMVWSGSWDRNWLSAGSLGRTGRFGTAALPAVPSACGQSWAECRGGVLAAGRSSFSPSWSMAAAVVPPEGDNQTAKWSLSSCSIEATVETATTV